MRCALIQQDNPAILVASGWTPGMDAGQGDRRGARGSTLIAGRGADCHREPGESPCVFL